jgi:hypothetical protein
MLLHKSGAVKVVEDYLMGGGGRGMGKRVNRGCLRDRPINESVTK